MTRTIGNVLALGLSVKRTAGMKGNTCDVLVGALFFILCLGYFSFTPTLTPNCLPATDCTYAATHG